MRRRRCPDVNPEKVFLGHSHLLKSDAIPLPACVQERTRGPDLVSETQELVFFKAF